MIGNRLARRATRLLAALILLLSAAAMLTANARAQAAADHPESVAQAPQQAAPPAASPQARGQAGGRIADASRDGRWPTAGQVVLVLLAIAAALAAVIGAIGWRHGDVRAAVRKNFATLSQSGSGAGSGTITGLLVLFVAVPIYLGYLLIQLWPNAPALTAGCSTGWGQSCPGPLKLFLLGHWRPSIDQRMLAIVLVAGALGAFVHAASAFGTFVGNREFKRSWALWYVVRMPIGAVLAVITYFVLRGFGILATATTGAGAGEINPFSHAAVAAMAGMFSKQATDKLAEVFDTLLRSSVRRADRIGGDQAPWIEVLDPGHAAAAAAADQAIRIKGTRFANDAVVKVDGEALPAARFTRRNDTLIDATIPKEKLANPAKLLIVVSSAQAGDSPPKTFEVR